MKAENREWIYNNNVFSINIRVRSRRNNGMEFSSIRILGAVAIYGIIYL